MTAKLCLCELSGEFHVLKNYPDEPDFCELCDGERSVHLDFTPENVEMVFRELYKKLEEIHLVNLYNE